MAIKTSKRASQAGTGTFLIGLALIFLFDLGVWPWIMFVIAASLLVTEYFEDGTLKPSDNRVIGAIVTGGIGLFGLIDLNIDWGMIWPVILIGVGLFLLFGDQIRGRL